MKKLSLILMCAILLSAIVPKAYSANSQRKHVQIKQKNCNIETNHRHRSPALIPIEAYYDSFISGIAITFLQELGNVEMNVTNHSTGEYLEGTITATTGTTVLPISGTEGVYTITFTLSNGTEYEGEFEI